MESVSSSSSEHDAFSEKLIDGNHEQYKKKGKKQKAKRCILCFLICVLLVLAIQVTFVPNLIRQKLDDGLKDIMIITSNKSAGYDAAQSNADLSDTGFYMECRFFNVTNVYDIISKGAFPQLSLTPPIVYTIYSQLYNVSWSKDKDWISYNGWFYNKLNQDRTYLDPSANITIFSPLLGSIYYGQKWGTDIFKNVKIYELSKQLKYINVSDLLFWRGTPKELLFEMYRINISGGNITEYFELDWGLLGNNGSNWNDTENAQKMTFTISNTGNTDMERINEMKYFGDFGEYLDCWNTPVSISPGHQAMWGMNKITKNAEEPLLMFTPLFFKNFKFDYNRSYTWKDNIELYRYTFQLSPQLDNFTNYPPNAEFYSYEYNGVQNLTHCLDGEPFFASLPYFLGGDKVLIDNLKKMNLSAPSWHDLPYIDVEPVTGIRLKSNGSFQMNTMIHSIDWIANDTEFSEGYYNIPDGIVVPLLIGSSVSEMIDSDLKGIKLIFDLYRYTDILEIFGYISVGVLTVLLVIFFTFIYYKFTMLPKLKISTETSIQ